MTLNSDAVETITVDSYGTLVDPTSAERSLADRVPDPESVSDLWRSQSIFYGMLANYFGGYQPFYEMNRVALQYALDVHSVDLSEPEQDKILSIYHELDVYDDVKDGLHSLTDAGYEVYVLSNGDSDMLDSMVEVAEIGDAISGTISADDIRTYKPAAELYHHAADRIGTPVGRILHVARPTFDVQGAKNVGMQAIWINRVDEPWERFGGEPDAEIESFHDLVPLLEN